MLKTSYNLRQRKYYTHICVWSIYIFYDKIMCGGVLILDNINRVAFNTTIDDK